MSQVTSVLRTGVVAQIWSMAWKDLRHDRHTTLVLVLTVAAILSPLLLLLGLKNGVIDTLRETLLRDPRNLEIIIHGSARLERAWFEEIGQRPDVAFLIPKTRTINTSVDLLDTRRRLVQGVEVIPTARGDPLLPASARLPLAANEVLVTETLARRLGGIRASSAEPGSTDAEEPALGHHAQPQHPAAPAHKAHKEGVAERPDAGSATDHQTGADEPDPATASRLEDPLPASWVTAIVKRSREGKPEHLRLTLEVVGMVPESRFSRDALFTSLDFLVALEDYRDGALTLAANAALPSGYGQHQNRFANARLYATELDRVSPLAAAISAQGIEVRTQAEKIATVQAMDRTLAFLFRVIAVIGGSGCALALGGALWVGVERKRRSLALLRLYGFTPAAVAALPILQGVVIAFAGVLLAALGYWIGANSFDVALGQNLTGADYLTHLEGRDLAMALGLSLLVALTAAGAGALRAARVSPAEGLRETMR